MVYRLLMDEAEENWDADKLNFDAREPAVSHIFLARGTRIAVTRHRVASRLPKQTSFKELTNSVVLSNVITGLKCHY